MALREYRCTACGLLDEKLIMPPAEPPATVPCARCGAEAVYQTFPSRIGLARSGMDNAPVDHFIGRDAEKRWEDIHRRQETREAVRKETGSVGLSMTGRNEFRPLTATQKELRTSLNEAVATGGYANPRTRPGIVIGRQNPDCVFLTGTVHLEGSH